MADFTDAYSIIDEVKYENDEAPPTTRIDENNNNTAMPSSSLQGQSGYRWNRYQQSSQPPSSSSNQSPPSIGKQLVVVSEKFFLPIHQFPTYNFVGKLLGPKGDNLRALQTSAKVRMSIKGRGSSKDKEKEEELVRSGDPVHQHFAEPLHVIVSAKAPRIVAHRRVAAGCRVLLKFMGPVNEAIHNNPSGAVAVGDPTGGSGGGVVLPAGVTPKIMFGVPPPGAIILNNNQAFPQGVKIKREPYSGGHSGARNNRPGDKRLVGGAGRSFNTTTKRIKTEDHSYYN